MRSKEEITKQLEALKKDSKTLRGSLLDYTKAIMTLEWVLEEDVKGEE